MNIRLLKIIDSLVGAFLTKCFPSALRRPFSTPNRFLLIRPGGIGDAALLAFPISCIKKTFPDSRITILAERRNSGTFLLIPQVDKVLLYDRPGDFVEALCGKFDLVIDTEQSHRLSAIFARLVRAPVKIGFDTNERRSMFTHPVDYYMDLNEVDNFLALLKPLGIECLQDNGAINLPLPHLSIANADQLLKPFHLEPFIVIFPGASIKEKRWGAVQFRFVAESLSSFGIKIVVVGGKEDRKLGEVITGGGLGLNLAGVTSLPETAAVIQKSALLLSGDSGVLHIAAGLGVPTVSLFGPGRAKKWAPRGEHHVVINKELPCSPCTTFGATPPCPNNVRCMSEITVDEVVNAVISLLTRIGIR